MDLKALLLTQGVILANCLCTFVAARQLAPEPSASSLSASPSSSSLCSRVLATTLWGAACAFFSLAADVWACLKATSSVYNEAPSSLRVVFVLGAPATPLSAIGLIFREMSTTLRFRLILKSSTNPELGPDTMSNKLRRIIDNILVILFGIKQPRGFLKSTRIVASTYIVLGMNDSTTLPSTHIKTENSPVNEDKMANALTLGYKTAENSCLMELNQAGKLALLESSILPNYKQLLFLDGRSGIATLIICVQAIGYVTSIVYRAIHHLPVSPIESIGFAVNMLVIVHSVVHSVGMICQNPLVIYLNPTQEQEMLDKCESTRWSNVDEVICVHAMILGKAVVGTVVVAFTILVEWYVLRISWLDAIGPILFLLSLFTQSYVDVIINRESCWRGFIFFRCATISFGGIVVSIVATVLHWQTNKFDTRTPSVIHNLPFLG